MAGGRLKHAFVAIRAYLEEMGLPGSTATTSLYNHGKGGEYGV